MSVRRDGDIHFVVCANDLPCVDIYASTTVSALCYFKVMFVYDNCYPAYCRDLLDFNLNYYDENIGRMFYVCSATVSRSACKVFFEGMTI